MVHASAQGLADSLNANEIERNLLYPDVERVSSLSLLSLSIFSFTDSLAIFYRSVKYRSLSRSKSFVPLKSSVSIEQKNSGQCQTRSSKSTFASKCTTLSSTPPNRPFPPPSKSGNRARFRISSFHPSPRINKSLFPSLSFPFLLLLFSCSWASRRVLGSRIQCQNLCIFVCSLLYQ